MTTKRGKIVRVGRIGRKFAQADLDTGERVDIPLLIMDDLTDRFDITATELVFIEAKGRAFTYVQWAGTEEELAAMAAAEGTTDVSADPTVGSGSRGSGGGIARRILWYVIFSGGIVTAINLLHLPQWVLYGYIVIAVIGLVMAVRDNS